MEDKTMENCAICFVFWLSDIINKCSYCLNGIYEENECIRDTVDSTVFISEYVCKACSCKREEPIEKSWISINYVDVSNTFIEKYTVLHNFNISQVNDYFSESEFIKTDLVILKSIDKGKKEPYYICSSPFNLINIFKVDYSTIRFLSITYRFEHEDPVSITLDKEWLLIGNEILGYTHILRMLEHQNQPFIFNMDYVLDIIDSDIQIFELKSDQFLKVNVNGYIICQGK